MCDTIRYLDLRAHGHTKVPQFHSSRKRVRQLLEDHATKPATNQPCEFSGEPRATFLVDFSPNKRWAASTHGDHTVRVTDVLTGKCIHILTGHPRTPWCLAFNPQSDDILASGCLGGEVRIWDLHGGGSEVLRNPNEGQVITSLAFHPSGDAVVFATLNKIYFWAWARSKPFALTQTKYEFERVRWLRFDPFGRYLYTGIANNSSGRQTSARPESVLLDNSTERLDTRRDSERAQARRRYNEVIRRVFDPQYLPGHQAPGPSQSYLDMSRPRSPVIEERLTLARQYARHLTALTSGPGAVHPVPRGAAPRSLYSNSRAGAWDTVLAPASRSSHYSGLRAGASSTDDSISDPSSISAPSATSSSSSHGFGQERRGRWGRYRPAFFSLSSEDGSQDNSDRALNADRSNNNNISNDEDENPDGNRSYHNMRLPGQRRRRFARASAVDYRRAVPPPVFVPFSVRREVSLGQGLETDEFEILPVDQGGGPGLSVPESNNSDLSTSHEENNSSDERASSRRSEVDSDTPSWDELQALFRRCCGNSNSYSEGGPSSQIPNTESYTHAGSTVPVTDESSSIIRTEVTTSFPPLLSRQNAPVTRGADDRTMLNSDPFMGYTGSTTEFLNIISNRLSGNSTTGIQGPSSASQNVTSQDHDSNQEPLIVESSEGSNSEESSTQGASTSTQRNSQDDSKSTSSESAQLKLNRSEESVHQNTKNDQGTDGIHLCFDANSGAQVSLSSKQSSNNNPPLRSLQLTETISQSQEQTECLEEMKGLGDKNENRIQTAQEATTSSGLRYPDSPSTFCDNRCPRLKYLNNRNEDTNTNVSEAKLGNGEEHSRTESNHKEAHNLNQNVKQDATHLEQSETDPNLPQYDHVIAGSQAKDTSEDEPVAGPSSCKAAVKRKMDQEASEDVPASKICKTTSEMKAVDDIQQSITENCQTDPLISKSDDVVNRCSSAHVSNSLKNTTPPLLSSVPLTATSCNSPICAVSSNMSTEHVLSPNLSFTQGVMSNYLLSVTSSSQLVSTASSCFSSRSPWAESSGEFRQNLGVSSCDVTATLTQALAAVHCSRPAVFSSGHHSQLRNNPFHSIESPGQASVALSSSSLNSSSAVATCISSSTASTSCFSHSLRGATLRRLLGSSMSSAFTVCTTSGQHDVTNMPAACSISSSPSTSFPNSQTSEICTVSSSSCLSGLGQSRSGSETASVSTLPERAPTAPHSWLNSLFGRRRQATSGARESLQSIGGTTEVSLAQDTQQQEPQALESTDTERTPRILPDRPHPLDIPLVERLDNLSRTMGERLQNLSRTIGRRATRLSQLQHRLSVLEETNRRMRFLHRECINRLNPSNPTRRLLDDSNRSLRRNILHRNAALLGRSSRTRSMESDTPSSLIAELRRDRMRRTVHVLADTMNPRLRRGETTSGSQDSGIMDLANLGSEITGSRPEENLEPSLPWPRPPNPFLLDAPRTSSNRLEYPSRLGFTPAPPAPAPGSLSNLLGVSSQSADNGGDSEEEDGEDQGQPIDPLAEDQNQDQTEHLHPDYQHSILGDGFGRHDDPLHYMINNTIAGTFVTRGEYALASNFVPQSHRIQRWSVATDIVPDISDPSANMVVRNCKLHNDASCSLSRDGKLLAAFVLTHSGFPDKMVLGIFSLENSSFAQCLYTKSFGPNAISVSISPQNSYVLVGTAAKRMFFFSANQMVGQVYKMVKQKAGESSMRHTTDLFYYPENRPGFCSVNSACWLPEVGMGLVFGTNKGDLVFSRPGSKKKIEREPYFWRSSRMRDTTAHRNILDFFPRRRFPLATFNSENVSNSSSAATSTSSSNNNNNNLVDTLPSSGSSSGWRSSATQTISASDHRSAATQTRNEEEEEEEDDDEEEEEGERVAEVAFVEGSDDGDE